MMAKVTITIEDIGGNVKVVMNPSAETMLKKIASHGKESLTAAEAYALAGVNRMRDLSKSAGRIITPVPRIGRR